MNTVIEFDKVSVIYPNGKKALDEISFSIFAGECFALVGESGCGKTTLARAALGLLPPKTEISGSIFAGGNEIVRARRNFLRKLRGLIIGFVSQNPFAAANPLATVGDSVAEAWRVHALSPPEHAIENALEKLDITDAKNKIRQNPFEWSGGMLQRAGIAAASAHTPQLIIADEPTAALDAQLNESVLKVLRKANTAVLLISHDLRLVEKHADKIAVMRDGVIVETGTAREIFENPQHEYTKKLLAVSQGERRMIESVSETARVVLEAKSLTHFYGENRIVENLDWQIRESEIVGICGASGCGKSTLLRLLMTIETPDTGEIFLKGELAAKGGTRKVLSCNARNGFVMPIFQDSLASLDNRWAIWRIVAEPLTANCRDQRFSKRKRREIAREKLCEVSLEDVNLDARPTELSGGQCQRIAIARVLAAGAKIIAADEPTSSLDVLSGERIMKLFVETARKGAAVLIVSHDRELLSRYCHRIYAMENGKLKLQGENEC